MYLLWLHCLFLFSLKFNCLQRLFLNENIDDNCWNIDHVLQTTWKWSNWRLTREQDGTNVNLISHIHVRFWSCVISFIVLAPLSWPSSDNTHTTCLLTSRVPWPCWSLRGRKKAPGDANCCYQRPRVWPTNLRPSGEIDTRMRSW